MRADLRNKLREKGLSDEQIESMMTELEAVGDELRAATERP